MVHIAEVKVSHKKMFILLHHSLSLSSIPHVSNVSTMCETPIKTNNQRLWRSLFLYDALSFSDRRAIAKAKDLIVFIGVTDTVDTVNTLGQEIW